MQEAPPQSTNLNLFVDMTESAGILLDPFDVFSVSWVDFNQDGWFDLWLGNHALGLNDPSLYLNHGDGKYQLEARYRSVR